MAVQHIAKFSVLFLLATVLSACSATKFMETPDESVASSDESSEANVYDPEIVASSSEAYGEEDTSMEDSPKFQEAVQVEPLLVHNIIYFRYDSSHIVPEAVDLLKRHAEYLLSQTDLRFVLEGHTDHRGAADYNVALGERRAQAAKKVLEGLGVPEDRLEVISYGEERPVVEGDDEDAYSKNRRVEIIYK